MKPKAPLLIAAALGLAACAPAPVAGIAPAERGDAALAKRVYVVRHLQKAQGDDPPLTAQGAANAQRLADLLADKGIVAVFATPTRRAMESAAPLAARLGLPVTPYDPKDPQALARAVETAAGSVLVVGHSNTVPELVDRLGGPPQPPLTEEDYGTLFIVRADGLVETITVR